MLDWICSATGAREAELGERIQSLWSGYGEIVRVRLRGASVASVVVKRVVPPAVARHPRGWDTDRSHARKLRSYEVEHAWHRDWSARCGEACRVPACIATAFVDGQWRFILEDLDDAGFTGRKQRLSPADAELCLRWLASFHATFLGDGPAGLWEEGTYWHLATRPDELERVADRALLEAAPLIDARLRGASHRTLVHGDAKVANFCFSPSSDAVAAVDFQYVGGGCGMKDVAYLLSCASPEHCEAHAERHLDVYFDTLRAALGGRVTAAALDDLEREWRGLYPFAWADFHRFLEGWSPGHWKLHRYGREMTRRALEQL